MLRYLRYKLVKVTQVPNPFLSNSLINDARLSDISRICLSDYSHVGEDLHRISRTPHAAFPNPSGHKISLNFFFWTYDTFEIYIGIM